MIKICVIAKVSIPVMHTQIFINFPCHQNIDCSSINKTRPWLNHTLSCNFSQYGPSTKLPRMNQPSIQSKKERKKMVCDFTFSFTRQGSVVKQAIRLAANCFSRISNISYSNMQWV